MRRRLMVLVLSSTVFALVLLGLLLLVTAWALMSAQSQQGVTDTARIAVQVLEDIEETGRTPTTEDLQRFAVDSTHLSATLSDGTVLTAGDPGSGATYSASASAGEVTVTASVPVSQNIRRMATLAAFVLVISLLVLALTTALASVYARRITRPLEEFGEMAGRIAGGDRRPLATRYGVPELDAVAELLDRGVSSFNDLLENEQRITTEASHQLRTPLTALSLRLEEIVASDDVDAMHADAHAALGQVERLAGVVDDVVGLGRGSRVAAYEEVAVDGLVRAQVLEWTPAFAAADRELRASGSEGLVVHVVPGSQSQALATLVENSLVHGAGTTTIDVRPSGDWVVLRVVDEGPGVPEALGATVFERSVSGGSSSGLGLALARTLVAADGGRLEMLSARPAVFAMFLPTRPDATRTGSVAVVERPEVDQAVVDSAASSALASSSGNTQRR